jgi:hypothetical protein
MPQEIINIPRFFQIWSYTVSHKEMLARSTKASGFPTRIDVFFKDVGALHLPTAFQGLAISEAMEREKAEIHLQAEALRLEGRKLFIVRGSIFTGYVVAGAIAWHEDEGEYNDPSYFKPKPS